MAWSLFYYDEAAQDIIAAKKWYKQQLHGLEKRFAADMKISIDRILSDPFIYEIKYKNIRVSYLDIFPYGIHFFVDERKKDIIIVGVFHQHRNPEAYVNR
ncbi:MAG: type II toxin-antitoxin system RelE/ParE family toxin [Mucilaginibacter sp.]